MQRLRVRPLFIGQRFRPTLDCGQWCPQLVRNRRNKVVFQLLRFGQLPCHIIDYITQLADLIVIFLFQPNTEIPLGNLSGSLPHLSQRDDNGIDKIGTGKHHKKDDRHSQHGNDNHQRDNLPVNPHQRGDISDRKNFLVTNLGNPGQGQAIFPIQHSLKIPLAGF